MSYEIFMLDIFFSFFRSFEVINFYRNSKHV